MKSPAPRNVGIELSDRQRLAWLRLIRSENIGASTFLDLIKRFGTASNALDALPELVAKSGRRPIRIASVKNAQSELSKIETLGGRLICLGEPNYPPVLRAADSPPPVLTIAGNAQCLTRDAVAFVGSRNASIAGLKFTRQLAAEVADAGYVIVSGLARGIDSGAHQASLASGTIAVFAGGIDHVYPNENKKLAHEIVDNGGCLISEMPFGWQPRAQDFPRRNRIIAGLSLALVVIEAARRSGSLISARLANEMGRLVFAVPGSPLDPRSEGTNHLIKQGAQLIVSDRDILEAIEPVSNISRQANYSLEEVRPISVSDQPDESDRARLLDVLDHTPIPIDDVIRHTGMELGKVQLIVLELDLAGLIERHAGNRISRQ